MKFPLSECPFPQLALSHAQCEEMARFTSTVLLETIAEYETLVRKHKRVLPTQQWKAVKTRENVTVYKTRDGDELIERTQPGLHTTKATKPSYWSLPKLVAVGTLVGQLDDVMYGVVAPASECVKLKTSYVDDDVLDDMVLQQLQYATVDDPYQFLGIKWVVKAGSGVGASPRDAVFLEATGTHVLPSGERIGYHLTHSLALPQLRDLKDLGILRATAASCSLFKQLTETTVDVYIKALTEPTGKLSERVVLGVAASEMIDCYKVITCAQNKKLAWLMRDAAVKTRYQNRQRGRGRGGDEFGDYVGVMKTDAKGKHCCAMCTHRFSAFRTAVTCELCKTIVCSRCKTARKLTYIQGTAAAVTTIPTAFCKNCITSATHMDAIEFARNEFVSAEVLAAYYRTSSQPTPSVVSTGSTRRRTATIESSDLSASMSSSSRGLRKPLASDDGRQLSLADTEGSSMALTAWSMDGSDDSELSFARDSVEIDVLDDRLRRPMAPGGMIHDQYETKGQMIVLKHKETPMAIEETPTPQLLEQQEMWMQMNQLRLQAEQVYRITRQNNQAMAESHVRQR